MRLRLVGVFVFLALALFLMSSCSGRTYEVVGEEMAPTFVEGQSITAVAVSPEQIQRGDPIVYRLSGGLYFKRVVGLPGETVRIDQGLVIINGIRLDETYQIVSDTSDQSDPKILDEDQFYILGDNRTDSYDSRHHGPIAADLIVGRVEVTWLNRLTQR